MSTVNMNMNMNMKKRIFPTLLLVVLSFSVIPAMALSKPSPEKIKQLIKEMLYKHKSPRLLGIDSFPNHKCENIKIENIRLLKIGRAKSSYYRSSGKYISSEFKVKFTAKGSCVLTPPYRINASEYDKYQNALRRANAYGSKKPAPVMPMDLGGRLPFRNIPFEAYIMTDDYGDWVALDVPTAFNKEDRHYTKKTKQYLKSLFLKKNGGKIQNWEKEQRLAAEKMSPEAESGLRVIKFHRLYTPEVHAMLQSKSKRLREFVYSTYWKLGMRRGNHAETDQFLREVIRQLKIQGGKTKSSHSPTKSRTNSFSSQSHMHGTRRHSHKLPRQGKAHRHGNGPIGR